MKHKKRYQIIDIIIMSILVAGIVIFIMVPFFNILAGAFYYENKFDLRYIKSLFDNKTLLFNSLRLGILTTALTLTAGICVSVYIFICSERLQKFWLMILGITMISPPFVTALSYINLFGRRGLISYRLLHLSVQPYGLTGIVLMQALSDFSLCSLLLYGVLKSIPGYMIDSAKSLGAKTNDIICDIILPNMMPGIKASALLTFLRSISDFGTPAIIGGKYNVLALESYLAVIAQGNLPRAAAVNLLLILPAAAVFVPYHKNLKNLGITSHGIETSNSKIVGKGIVYNCIKAIALFFLLWIGMQYISIIFSAFTRMKKGSLVITLENIEETLPYINQTTLRSIIYSVIAASCGSIMGLLIGYYMQIRKIKFFFWIDLAATLPYVIPGTFFGLGYLLAFRQPPLMITGTAAIVVLNVIFKQLPFSTKIGNAAMEGINIEAVNAVRDLGGGRHNEILDVILPLSRRQLGLSFINAFTSTMTTIGSIIFLIHPGHKVLTLVMFDVIQSGKYNIGSVLALWIIIICIVINGSYMFITSHSS